MAQLPKPFSRPSVSLSVPEEKRDWKIIPASDLTPGDIVTSYGKVEEVSSDVGVTVVLWLNGNTSSFESGDSVHAFVRIHV